MEFELYLMIWLFLFNLNNRRNGNRFAKRKSLKTWMWIKRNQNQNFISFFIYKSLKTFFNNQNSNHLLFYLDQHTECNSLSLVSLLKPPPNDCPSGFECHFYIFFFFVFFLANIKFNFRMYRFDFQMKKWIFGGAAILFLQ